MVSVTGHRIPGKILTTLIAIVLFFLHFIWVETKNINLENTCISKYRGQKYFYQKEIRSKINFVFKGYF